MCRHLVLKSVSSNQTTERDNDDHLNKKTRKIKVVQFFEPYVSRKRMFIYSLRILTT